MYKRTHNESYMLQHITTQAHVPASLFLEEERQHAVLRPQVRTPLLPQYSQQALAPGSENSEGFTDVLTRATGTARCVTSCLTLTRSQLTGTKLSSALGSHPGQSSCSDLEVLSHSENSCSGQR